MSNVEQGMANVEGVLDWPDDACLVPENHTVIGLFELLLKNPARLDELAGDPARQRELFPRLLLIAQAGYLVYSAVMLLLLNLAPDAALPASLHVAVPSASWADGSALGLPVGYGMGLVIASCICLPSFYFYSLLAGVRMSWLQIASIVLRGSAANGVMLLGIVPIYVAVALGLLVTSAPAEWLGATLLFGLLLPFVAGLWGLREIYRGVMHVGANLSIDCRRQYFLRRLTLSWAAVYTAVVPVLIYRLWESVAALAATRRFLCLRFSARPDLTNGSIHCLARCGALNVNTDCAGLPP